MLSKAKKITEWRGRYVGTVMGECHFSGSRVMLNVHLPNSWV